VRPHWHTALKRQNMPAEGVDGETDRGEPIDSLAERGQVAQKGAVRAESAYASHCRLRGVLEMECIAPCGAAGNMRPPRRRGATAPPFL
jgi:hypothetical protein